MTNENKTALGEALVDAAHTLQNSQVKVAVTKGAEGKPDKKKRVRKSAGNKTDKKPVNKSTCRFKKLGISKVPGWHKIANVYVFEDRTGKLIPVEFKEAKLPQGFRSVNTDLDQDNFKLFFGRHEKARADLGLMILIQQVIEKIDGFDWSEDECLREAHNLITNKLPGSYYKILSTIRNLHSDKDGVDIPDLAVGFSLSLMLRLKKSLGLDIPLNDGLLNQFLGFDVIEGVSLQYRGRSNDLFLDPCGNRVSEWGSYSKAMYSIDAVHKGKGIFTIPANGLAYYHVRKIIKLYIGGMVSEAITTHVDESQEFGRHYNPLDDIF